MEYRLEVVVVPVTDVDRAKHFYADMLGFHVDVDHAPSDEIRIVQLTPEGSGCSVTIGKGLADMAPGSLKGLQLCVADIEAEHAALSARGVSFVDAPHLIARMPDHELWMCFFRDPDEHLLALMCERRAPA